MTDLEQSGKITIGPYTVETRPNSSFWIAHESGEGMQVSALALLVLIDKFYQENF